MSRPPRGFTAAWSAIGGGALALVVFQAVHHAPPSGSRAAPGPAASASAAATGLVPVVSLPGAPGASGGTVGGERGAGASRSARASATASVRPSPSTSGSSSPPAGPSPSPSPAGVVGVSAAVVVPLRGSTPAAVRAALVIPAAPPFPLSGLGLALAVQ